MYIDLSIFPQNLFRSGDIIINDLRTYPHGLVDILTSQEYSDKALKNYFNTNPNYSILGVHFTRLMNDEIKDIVKNGFHGDSSSDYKRKIQNIPKEFERYKPSLRKFVAQNRRSEGKVYFNVGRIELYSGNTVFLKNWGGETLYCYYDNQCNTNSLDHLVSLGNGLRRCSIPCIVIVRVNADIFFMEFFDRKGLIECMKRNQLSHYSNESMIDRQNVNVVAVFPIKDITKFRK